MGQVSASASEAHTKLTMTSLHGVHDPQAWEQSGKLEPATWSVSDLLCFIPLVSQYNSGFTIVLGLVPWRRPWSVQQKQTPFWLRKREQLHISSLLETSLTMASPANVSAGDESRSKEENPKEHCYTKRPLHDFDSFSLLFSFFLANFLQAYGWTMKEKGWEVDKYIKGTAQECGIEANHRQECVGEQFTWKRG